MFPSVINSYANLVLRDFSLAWGRGAPSPSQGNVPGNEVSPMQTSKSVNNDFSKDPPIKTSLFFLCVNQVVLMVPN